MTLAMERWDNAALPRPTQDRARLEADLDEFGYCVVARALDGAALAEVRQRLAGQAEGERAPAIDYCAPQCRPLENYTRGVRPEVMAGLAPALLARLGFATWASYGHTGDPDTRCSLPGDQALGELRPEHE
jgi:hypothetical protein